MTSDTPPVSKHLHDTGANINDQTGSDAIDSQGRMVPTESQIEDQRPHTETFPLHDSHPKGKETPAFMRSGIEVSNGNGTTGMARKVRDYLKTRGLEVNRLTNANHFNHRVSKIYYQEGYQEAASHLAGQLPAIDGMEKIKRFDRPNIHVKLLIGKDLVPHQRSLEKE